MSDILLVALVVLALAAAVFALASALLALRHARPRRRTADHPPLPTDLTGLRAEVERLRQEAAGSLRHLAMVRYDAFGDMGGRLSWSLALADDRGDGVVVTSIAGRSEARTYAKALAGWRAEQPLSPEEESAVTQARSRKG